MYIIFVFESTGFRSQLQEFSLSSHTDEFWWTETDLSVDANMYMLPYPHRVELSSEWSNLVAISVYARLFI